MAVVAACGPALDDFQPFDSTVDGATQADAAEDDDADNGPVATRLRWSFELGGRVTSSPAIGADGTIYIGSELTTSGQLYAITPDGDEDWSVDVYAPVTTAIALTAVRLYFGCADGSVRAVSRADGGAIWSYPSVPPVLSSPAVGADGTVYIGTGNGMHAITPDGKEKWARQSLWQQHSSPAISADGSTVYYGDGTDGFFAVDAQNGTLEWRDDTGAPVVSSPAIADDGTVVVGLPNGHIRAYSPDGGERWSVPTLNVVGASPAIGMDGTVYNGSDDTFLHAIRTSGTTQWKFPTGAEVISTPAVAADGTVYVGSANGTFYAVTSGGQKAWEFPTGDVIYASPAIAADGTVYVGSFDGKLYALNGTSPMAASAWPKFRRSTTNTGHASSSR